MIYLDNAATTKIHDEVLDAMMPYLTEEYGNPGSLYRLGATAKRAVEKAREQVAEFVGARNTGQIMFTSGGTESNNMVVNPEHYRYEINHIITSEIEHDSILRLVGSIRSNVTYLPVNEFGVVSVRDLKRHITRYTGIVSIMYMNNEIGSINPVKEIAELCNDKGILFHTDCVQAAGCIPINVQDIDCDFASISSHKIHGPKGVGALYARDRMWLEPMIYGGSSQEYGFRGGTENVAGIVGFGKACEIFNKYSRDGVDVCKALTELKTAFWTELKKKSSELGMPDVCDNASSASKPGKTLNVRFPGVDGEALVCLLGTKGVCISAGSACTSHEQKPSHVLMGIGLSENEARESVRISFSMMNNLEEVIEAADIIANAARNLLDIAKG